MEMYTPGLTNYSGFIQDYYELKLKFFELLNLGKEIKTRIVGVQIIKK